MVGRMVVRAALHGRGYSAAVCRISPSLGPPQEERQGGLIGRSGRKYIVLADCRLNHSSAAISISLTYDAAALVSILEREPGAGAHVNVGSLRCGLRGRSRRIQPRTTHRSSRTIEFAPLAGALVARTG